MEYKEEGSYILGIFLSWIITAPFVWVVVLIAEKPKTRRGAFISFLIQVIIVLIIIIKILGPIWATR